MLLTNLLIYLDFYSTYPMLQVLLELFKHLVLHLTFKFRILRLWQNNQI